jgi:hypothetical protein
MRDTGEGTATKKGETMSEEDADGEVQLGGGEGLVYG